MSTTFGIEVPALWNNSETETINIAFRSNNTMIWLNSLAPMLADDIEVIAVDNSSQGINTVGDIRKEIKTQKELEETE